MKLRYFIAAFFLLIGQIGFSQNVFTKIPTPPHKHEVDIFFTHELPIQEPHYRTSMIEVQGENDYNTLIGRLKKKAQLMGADAVIIIEKDIDYLAGIGIKYKKNNNQIFDTLNVIKKISIIPIDNKTISGDILFDMDGKLKEGQSDGLIGYFIENVYHYDFKFLVNDKSPRWKESTDMYSRLKERRLYKDVTDYGVSIDKLKVLRFNYYETTDKIESITVNDKEDFDVTEEWRKEKLVPINDEKGNLIELKVYWRSVIVRRQKLFYDEKKRIIMADWARYEKGVEVPFLRVEYKYFQTEDLPK
jgi:hypothetical protein